jgi:hypothetical protein
LCVRHVLFLVMLFFACYTFCRSGVIVPNCFHSCLLLVHISCALLRWTIFRFLCHFMLRTDTTRVFISWCVFLCEACVWFVMLWAMNREVNRSEHSTCLLLNIGFENSRKKQLDRNMSRTLLMLVCKICFKNLRRLSQQSSYKHVETGYPLTAVGWETTSTLLRYYVKYKKHNSAICFVWAWNLVSRVKGKA